MAPFPVSPPAPPAKKRFAPGLALFMGGDREAAREWFAQAAGEFPADAEAQYFHGLALFKLGRYREAIAPLRRSADLHPGEDALIKLAMAQGQVQDLAGCLATLREAVRRLPGSADARAYLGTTLRTLDRLGAALGAYRAALRLDPHHVPALWGMGLALGMAGRAPEGMAVLRRAIQLQPAFPPPHFHLGVLAWTTGDTGEARAQQELLQDLAPSYAARLAQIMQADERKDHVRD
jgi:tetratricopeptide (TPR) repeat protein